jgi:hypothetical protein
LIGEREKNKERRGRGETIYVKGIKIQGREEKSGRRKIE